MVTHVTEVKSSKIHISQYLQLDSADSNRICGEYGGRNRTVLDSLPHRARIAFRPVDELVDEEPGLVIQPRQHTGAFHAHRLVKKNNDEDGNDDGNQYVAHPELKATGFTGWRVR